MTAVLLAVAAVAVGTAIAWACRPDADQCCGATLYGALWAAGGVTSAVVPGFRVVSIVLGTCAAVALSFAVVGAGFIAGDSWAEARRP